MKNMKKAMPAGRQGFTLIELLVVIGVMAVIAAGVIATINPAQKLAQARDATTQSAVGQIASAMQAAAAVSPTGLYPAVGTLVGSGELTVLPVQGDGVTAVQTSAAGATMCVWGTMTALRNTTPLTTGNLYCWCSNTGTTTFRTTCP